MYIVLLGPPGSGKGTQGQMLSKKLAIPHLSTGDLFREILDNDKHELYKPLQVIKEGKLVSDDIVNKVVAGSLRDPRNKDGIIFDGYPRTMAQARALDQELESIGKTLDVVIDIHVTKEVLLGRLLGRRSCPNCKRIFHVSQGISECPDCKVALIQRADDNEETILDRFEEYQSKTAPLQEYYRQGRVNYIDIKVVESARTADSVQQEVWDRLLELGLV
ncbi:MAG: nucleoside monophosphate kinase [Clostridiales bacterium]|nr:nucleoside monophosphate kinase [Clostridiales bacterium]